MEKMGWWNKWWSPPVVRWLSMVVLSSAFLVSVSSQQTPNMANGNQQHDISLGVEMRMHSDNQHVIMDNGLLQVTLSIPEGDVTGIQFNGIDNLLETQNEETNRGYWDVVWNKPGNPIQFDKLAGTNFTVIKTDENQLELSFTKTWNSTVTDVPLNVDKRYVILRGSPGFYTYAIFDRPVGFPEVEMDQVRTVFKLQENKFSLMVISDKRHRQMPLLEDRNTGQPLAYPEAVLLTSPNNTKFRGEVDDKYQYSCEDKDNKVHGWISMDSRVGFWLITPSDEFRTSGPVKQDLTSHVGPITLSMFVSTHYAGKDAGMKFMNREPWKKVFGPIFVHVNSILPEEHLLCLWQDAKEMMLTETEKWPYNFPVSDDFPRTDQRGGVEGQLLVRDRYINEIDMSAAFAYVGLAAPGFPGSWQTESKGYQFWTRADEKGNFIIKDVRVGVYNLYAWVPCVISDYRYAANITILPGSRIKMGSLVYEPPRDGPTLWEIGIPDRTAAEFYVPDANPKLINKLYAHNLDKFRQYGLWARYADLYPNEDLIFTVGVSNYRRDWFFAHVTREIGNKTYQATTWQVRFNLQNITQDSIYKMRLALASATDAEIQVRINNPNMTIPEFTTRTIGKDNAIARHGIHGLYWFYSIDVLSSKLVNGNNTIFLTQSRCKGPFQGVMYDYIRLEGPSTS